MGDSVSAAAQQAQTQARQSGTQVGTAVRGAVHEAQDQARQQRETEVRSREMEAENRDLSQSRGTTKAQ